MTAVLINGINLGTALGYYADRVGGWLGSATVTMPGFAVGGRSGVVTLPSAEGEARAIRIEATARFGSADLRRTGERRLADLVRSGVLRVVIDDDLTGTTQIEARLRALATMPFGPSLSPLASRVTLDLVAASPYWRDVEPTTRAIAAVATRYTVPLGTAPSTPIIRVMGSATTPTLTYRDAGGASVWAMTLATLASDEYLDIDMGTGKITFFDSGVSANGISKLTSGNFPWALDPQDGDYGTSAWPTVEISAGSAEILWWRQWL